MYLLGIESSTKKLSIAISSSSSVKGRIAVLSEKGFMKNIIFLVDRLFRKTGLNLDAVDGFCVNTGPGDFTGTRIGLSIAKTFSMIEEKPLYGIDSLDIFAVQVLALNAARIYKMLSAFSGKCNILIVPVIDVRRGELFFSIYVAGVFFTSETESVCSVRICNMEIFVTRISGNHLVEYEKFPLFLERVLMSENLTMLSRQKSAIFLSGTAFDSYGHLYDDLLKLKYSFFLDKKSFLPEAEYLNLCAFFKILSGSPHQKRVVPYYVREFLPSGGKQ